MASFAYNIAKKKLIDGALNFGTADVRVALVKQFNTSNPDQATVAAVLDGTNNIEANFTNYARKALATQTTSQDDANDWAEFDHEDLVYTSAGGATNNTVVGMLYFVFVTNDTDSYPISYHDITDVTTNGGDITLQPGADGVLHIA